MQLTSTTMNGKREGNKMKFFIQLAVLWCFAYFLGDLWESMFPTFIHTGTGLAIELTVSLAIGWYWVRMWNYVESRLTKKDTEETKEL